jgi:hypothetical protein
MEKYGVTAEQAGDGSPDLAWLRDRDFGRLPDGIEALAGREHKELVLWIEDRRVVVGDTLVDFGRGLGGGQRALEGGPVGRPTVRRKHVLDRQCE